MDFRKGFSGIIDDAGFLDKIIHRQRGEKFCGSVGRKNMVRSCKVVTQRFARVFAKENSSGIMYLHHILEWIFCHDFKMLRCNRIYCVDSLLMGISHKDIAEIIQ